MTQGLICCYNSISNAIPTGTSNHPRFDPVAAAAGDEAAVGPLAIMDDSEVMRLGELHWEALSGRPAL
jgi:hypothetical protein